MDEARRRSLIARFQAGSLERIARIRSHLADLAAGTGGAQELLRELHTLKGEARMLGFVDLSELAHAVEERLQAPEVAERAAGEAPRIAAALEEAARWLRAGSDAPGDRLAAHANALRAGEAAPAPAHEPEDRARGAAGWVQVAAGRVDTVCERLSELETEFRALATQLAAAPAEGGRRRGDRTDGRTRRALLEQASRCRTLLEEASDAAWSLRLVPVEPSLHDMAVHARELALGLGKPIEVTVTAAGAEMERSVLDELRQPLLHLTRNAIDHGLEPPGERGGKGPGRLTISAEPSDAGVCLIVADDGRGVSGEQVRATAVARGMVPADAALTPAQTLDLLFRHGFSTRDDVSTLSGRGIGLDVVRSKVEALGGTVRIDSTPGRGTRVALDVPAKIAKERALVVAVSDALFGLPSRWVREVRRHTAADVVQVAGGRALRHEGELVPLRSLAAVLGGAAPGLDEPWVVLVEWASQLWALLAPAVLGEFELLRRPIDAFVAQCGPVVASSILDDGRLVLLTRPGSLLRRAETAPRPRAARATPAQAPRRRILVVDDSPVIRDLVSTLLEAAGLDVTAADGAEPALRACEEHPPDLVLADVEMPGTDGLELLRLIRLRTDHLPVVMLTTRGSAEDKQRAAELGADAYLVKSEFHERTLIETVRRFIGGSLA